MLRAGPGPPSIDVFDFPKDVAESPLPTMHRITSPLSKYIESEHQQGGLFSLAPAGVSLDASFDFQKKRRKKCGVCTPCLRRENCGTCANCLNRRTGKQICKLRKCEELKRRQNDCEVEYSEDNTQGCLGNTELTAQTISKVTSVDGPKSGSQMEIGSHDRLQEGILSPELANGGNQNPNNDRPSRESEQENSRSVPPRECWVLGPGKVSDTQKQPGWSSASQGEHHEDTKDINNLVAFSNIAGSMPPSTPSSCHRMQPNTTQLYEKFTQEMGAESNPSVGSPKKNFQHPEDLNTLQTALSQAKHGNKPPNCDCDGPDCPDYLEWLEKKMKLVNREDQGASKTVEAPPQLQAHLQHQTEHHHLINGSHQLPARYPHQHHTNPSPHVDKVPCSKPPIPCSPQVLSIAKENNVSLQTAIAIEALTQLSGTGPQSAGSATYNAFIHQHQNITAQTPNRNGFIPSNTGTCTTSSRSQSVPPGLNTGQQTCFEYHRPQSQGQPLPCSTSPLPGQGQHPDFSSNPQQWQQPWMAAKASTTDPMSELKQLLGDTSGRFNNFKLPISQHVNHNGGFQDPVSPALARVKQEPESGENFHHIAPGHYSKGNGQQLAQHFYGNSLPPGQTAISHSTQAALQQHLTYKRNLFSNSPGFGTPGSCAPVAGQNLKKWWPQMENLEMNPMTVKQEPKEPKKKRSIQASPSTKAMGGLLTGPMMPKPKQIVIKKTKQKASMPTFLPHSQISIKKSPVNVMNRATDLTNLPQGPLPLHGTLTQAAPTQTQSQVFNFNPSTTPSYISDTLLENTSNLVGKFPIPNTKSVAVNSLASNNTNTTTVPTSSTTSSTSQLESLMSIDPKYEDLIRQFEAEFGESSNDTHTNEPTKTHGTTPLSNLSQCCTQDLSPSKSTTCHLSESSTPSVLDEPDNEVPHSKPGLSQASTGAPLVAHPKPQPPIFPETIHAKEQQSSLFDATFSMPCSPLPKRMKLEASGDIAVLSTTCYSEEDTPTKDSFPSSPSLKGFLESPLRYLDSPTKSVLDTPSKDLQAEFPTCTCVDQILEKDEGPYYNHLGSGPTVASIRNLMETRYGERGEAVRVEKVVYTGREGKSSRGCPIAKWVIRRANEAEKLLCLVRPRAGHHCENAVIIILIMAWEGVPKLLADKLYSELSETLTKFGNPTSRRCGLNDDRTCACQGKDSDSCGASFSFGCSWSMYFNGCKYARSKVPRKFRLQGDRPEEEEKLRDNFQTLATNVAPLYKQLAPQAYSNQCLTESKAPDCRLGLEDGRPFSGVTACMDFCAHAHKDQHNLYNGCTVVCTLTSEDNRKVAEIPVDEQLHVLPLYKVSLTDEFGSEEAQRQKMKTGAIQVLQAFRREVRKLPEPAKSCRQRRLDAKKAASEKKKSKLLQQSGQTPDKIVKTELCVTSSPQPQGNKAIIKQEVKPSIKKEPYNGSIDDFNIHPNPAYYARGGLPPTGHPPAADPVNGYHRNPPPMHYNHYGYPPNALFPSKMRTYEGRHGSLNKPGAKDFQVDTKPDVHTLQARLAQSYAGLPEQPDQTTPGLGIQPPEYSPRPSSVSSEPSNRITQIIKQEPMDVSVYEGTVQSHSGASTPSTTPQPTPWPQQPFNSGIVPPRWEHHSNPKQSTEDPSINLDRSHQHRQPSPYPQPWTSLPRSNMASPAPSPSMHMPPSPSASPRLGSVTSCLKKQGSSRPSTPGSGTPYPGTPQPDPCHSGPPTPQPGTPRHWPSPAPSPQPNAWPVGHAAYSPHARQIDSSGAYPDNMWSKTAESRCSTPLGLQEKAWKSCGGSFAGRTPSPAPEGRLFPDALQQHSDPAWDPSRADSDVESTKGKDLDDDEVWSDSEHNFLDPNIGGVAVAPAHGSILIECARRELHATTPLKKPDRAHPSRISLVFYQHKNLNQPVHGLHIWEAKMKLLAEKALQRQQEAALLGLSQEEIKALSKKRKWGTTVAGAVSGPGQSKDKREGPVTRLASTFYTSSMVTVSPYAFTRLTGPYNHFV